MFTVYCWFEECGRKTENFLALDYAVLYAVNCSLCKDVARVDIISAETGELLFVFEEGILKEMSPSIYYEY